MTATLIALGACLLGHEIQSAAPSGPLPAEASPTASPPPRARRFVLAFMPGATMGMSPLPSLDVPLYFGGFLPRGPWALGYQFTFSVGGAERYIRGFVAHRHHLTALRPFGDRDRLFAAVGGGIAFLAYPVDSLHPEVRPVIEAEGRLGLRFAPGRRGVLGVLLRLGWNTGFGELAPLPQFGLFIGGVTRFAAQPGP